MYFIEDIDEICRRLLKGEVMLNPTDTIWGLGCNACNKEAVERIIEIKKRPSSKSFIVLVDSWEMLHDYVEDVVEDQMRKKWEEPVSRIFERGRNLPRPVLSESGSVAIRIIEKGWLRELITSFSYPLVSSSANFSGMPSAPILSEIDPEIRSKVDFIVGDVPQQGSGKASKIVKWNKGTWEIIRD